MVRYATVPFRPEMREKDLQSARAAKIVSEQMEEQITRMVSGGWIFHSYLWGAGIPARGLIHCIAEIAVG
jgi:hypothetical protein